MTLIEELKNNYRAGLDQSFFCDKHGRFLDIEIQENKFDTAFEDYINSMSNLELLRELNRLI